MRLSIALFLFLLSLGCRTQSKTLLVETQTVYDANGEISIHSDEMIYLERKIVRRNVEKISSLKQGKGQVVLKISIDQEGDVRSAVIVELLTTIKDENILKEFINAAMGYKYEANPEAPEYEFGALVFNLENRR